MRGGSKRRARRHSFFACYVNASDFCNGEVSRNGEIWDRAYRKILSMTAYAACAQDERFRIARSAEDIMNMESAAQTAGILTVEEGGVLNGSTERLDKLYDSGVRLITLTWNYENCIGSPKQQRTRYDAERAHRRSVYRLWRK